VAPATGSGRYWLVEIDDEDNSDGYVEFGRLFISRGYQPSRNFIYDSQFGWQDDTQVTAALGAEYFDLRSRRRVFNCTIENLPLDEAMSFLFEMQRRLGKHGQLVVALDPDDTVHKQRRSFVARHFDLTPLTNPNHGLFSAALQLREIMRQ
jgi:hypothetical protein